MICPNCGKEYNEKMTCCISCGADLVPTCEKDSPAEERKPDGEALLPPVEASAVPYEAAIGFDEGDIAVPLRQRSGGVSLSGAARLAGSFLAAAVMFALILTSAAASGLMLITDEGRIAEFAERLDVMSLPASGFSDSYSDTVQDAVFAMSQGTGLTRDDIKAIYEQSTAKSFLAEQLTGYAEYIRSGTAPERLTSEQLKTVFEENIPLIDSTMGYPLNDSDIALACSEIERAEPLLEMLSHENMEQSLGESTLVAIRLFGSAPAVAVTAAMAAAMLIVLRAVNKKSTSALGWGGGAILAGGAAVLAITFLFSAQLPYSGTDRLVRAVLKCTCDVISPDLYRVGAILAIIGAVMLLWAESLRRNAKS